MMGLIRRSKIRPALERARMDARRKAEAEYQIILESERARYLEEAEMERQELQAELHTAHAHIARLRKRDERIKSFHAREVSRIRQLHEQIKQLQIIVDEMFGQNAETFREVLCGMDQANRLIVSVLKNDKKDRVLLGMEPMRD